MKKNQPARSELFERGRAIDKPFSSRPVRGMRMTSVFSLLLLVAACGSHEAPPPRGPTHEEDVEASAPEAVEVVAPSPIPDCNADAEDCLPPSNWVSKLCSGVHPEV